RFAIVEGKVLSVRESGPTIYVNFGRRWTQDFTVTIAKRNESAFTSAGLEPKRLQGRRVRVRGYVEQRGGPWVEATQPEQIGLAARSCHGCGRREAEREGDAWGLSPCSRSRCSDAQGGRGSISANGCRGASRRRSTRPRPPRLRASFSVSSRPTAAPITTRAS